MSTRVPFNAASAAGKEIADFIDAVNEVLAKGRRLKSQLDSMVSGAPATYAQIETEVGGMGAGDGQTLWTIISTAVAQIDAPQIAELARLDQG